MYYVRTYLDPSLTGSSDAMVDVDAHVCAQLSRRDRTDLQGLVSTVDMATEVAHCTAQWGTTASN